MDFDILQTMELFGKVFTGFLNDFLSLSRSINDHSATITIAFAFFAWFLYRHRTKRRLKVEVHISTSAPKFFKDVRKMKESGKFEDIGSAVWNVYLINPGYYTVYVEEAGLLYRDWLLGKKKEFPVPSSDQRRMEIKPGDKKGVQATYRTKNIESCLREIWGAYAKDKTGKVWRIRKKLKIEE